MAIRQITRDIIKLVEERSGIPVRITEDPKLDTTAVVRMARRGGAPVHLVLYRPIAGVTPDYRICYECCFILRQFSVPPEKRFDLGYSPRGHDAIEKLMTAPGGVASAYRLDAGQVQELADVFLSGLLIHLRSIPVGLRINQWLAEHYPDLGSLEDEYVKGELDTALRTLADNIRQSSPAKVFQATQAINAAYANFWAEKLGRPEIRQSLPDAWL